MKIDFSRRTGVYLRNEWVYLNPDYFSDGAGDGDFNEKENFYYWCSYHLCVVIEFL